MVTILEYLLFSVVFTTLLYYLFIFFKKSKKIIEKNYEYHYAELKDKEAIFDFAGNELFPYQATLAIHKIARTKNRREKRKKSSIFDVNGRYTYEYTEKIAKIAEDVLSNHFYVDWAFEMIELMEVYHFNLQPSVNLRKDNVHEICINVSNENYEKLATVNLMEHTYNVIIEFYEYYKLATRKPLNDSQLDIIFMSCLMHDFGKSIELVKANGLFEKKMEYGLYRHHELSCTLVLIYIEQQTVMIENTKYYHQMNEIAQVVLQHHHQEFNKEELHPLVKIVIDIDKKAREKEMLKINAIETKNYLEEKLKKSE